MSGFYKTVIHWAKCFLTGRGEDISDPTYGTIIGSMIGVGNGNLAEVRDLVYISVGQATSKIQEYQTRINDLTLSEKLVSAEIEDFSQPSADEFKLSIRLRNASGELLLMRLPIDVTSRRA